MLAFWQSLDNKRILWATLPLLAVLVIGAIAISLVSRWRKQSRPARLSASEQLAHFRQLYEKGEMSAEEFANVRTLLSARMKKEMDLLPEESAPESPAPVEEAKPAAPPKSTPNSKEA